LAVVLTPDCLILGGGIAGLWTLRTLLAEGYDALLVETEALGSGQTIASQAILHAGTKYALTGHAAEASRSAAQAAAIWRDCLRGGPPRAPSSPTQPPAFPATTYPDLTAVTVLSPHTHMFTTPGVASRLTGLAASKALVSGPRKLARTESPAAFADAPAGVDVYQLDEPVLGLPSLLHTLSDPARARLIHAHAVSLARSPAREAELAVSFETRDGPVTLAPRALVCTAGAGNERLLAQLELSPEIRMQRRPLHMVLARGADLPHLYAHCVSLSDKPRATITTTTDATGRAVWYIGGQLAESGVDRSREDQIAEARAELAKILPWIDTASLEFATHRVDRAEGLDEQGRRPDTPIVRRTGPVIACWPTKLVLAPLAAASVRGRLAELGIEPTENPPPPPPFPTPPIATPLWDREDLAWS
jgi:glycine/D-amino acid oxidase-like deaminating enzyme